MDDAMANASETVALYVEGCAKTRLQHPAAEAIPRTSNPGKELHGLQPIPADLDLAKAA